MSFYFIEIMNGDAVVQSGRSMADLGTRMQETNPPPTPDFGDDQFGAAMREQYPTDAELTSILTHQSDLGGRLSELGTNLAGAIVGLQTEDDDASQRLREV